EHALLRLLLEPEAAVDLAREVLARLVLELRALAPDLRVLEGVVAGLEHEWDEADPALDRDEAQLRVARQHPREEQVDELLAVVAEERHGGERIGGADAEVLEARRREPRVEAARSDVEGD